MTSGDGAAADRRMRQLHQEILLDHARRPRNREAIAEAFASGPRRNPGCGDEVTIYLRRDAEGLVDLAFTGSGCTISVASASLLTECLKGSTIDQLRDRMTLFRDLMRDPAARGTPALALLGKLLALGEVGKYPVRVKCAMLPWVALEEVLSRVEAVEPRIDPEAAAGG